MSNLLTTTLSIIAALESNSGQNTKHIVIRSPASMHFGTSAVGEYGMMPETLKTLKVSDATLGAKKLATALLARKTANVRGYLAPSSPCPFITAVVLWQQGPNFLITPQVWSKKSVTRRIKRARIEWSGPIRRLPGFKLDANGVGRTFQ